MLIHMKILKQRGYKWFINHYPYTYDSMFKTYRSRLENKYQWFIILEKEPIWVNGNIEEVFDYLHNTKEESVIIKNNWCENSFKEPVKYLYYNIEDFKSRQKIYGTYNKLIRLDYSTDKFHFCNFENNKGSFSCGENFFQDKNDFLLMIGRYTYKVNGKHIFTLVNSDQEKLETEDIEKIHRFAESMKAKKYNGLFDKVANRLLEIF